MKRRVRTILGGLLLLSLGGCGATREVQIRSYMQDMQRVDQNRDAGNAGYIMGAPVDDGKEYKKTRKVYILEVNRSTQVTDTNIDVEESFQSSSPAPVASVTPPSEPEPVRRVVREEQTISTRRIQLPDFDNETYYKEAASSAKEPVRYVEYTIEKNDTLQKISKKFYDSFSQWTKIYDANRNKIDNPDVLKPGVTIQIPVYK